MITKEKNGGRYKKRNETVKEERNEARERMTSRQDNNDHHTTRWIMKRVMQHGTGLACGPVPILVTSQSCIHEARDAARHGLASGPAYTDHHTT